tara:strand:- start:4117 stop:4704 length:588 start_codon:yes stop_codon:yes gene_type:complete
MSIKPLISIVFIIGLLFGCSNSGKLDRNLTELDKVYGKCDNPHRQLRPLEYKICKDKERAAGPGGEIKDPISVGNILNFRNKGTIVSASDTNNYLWDASLEVLKSYSLKISDYEGGYVETNWIQDINTPSERCLIKSHIVSRELIATGVKVKIICEKKIDDVWYIANEEFLDEEKQLTLKILSIAREISNLSEQS